MTTSTLAHCFGTFLSQLVAIQLKILGALDMVSRVEEIEAVFGHSRSVWRRITPICGANQLKRSEFLVIRRFFLPRVEPIRTS